MKIEFTSKLINTSLEVNPAPVANGAANATKSVLRLIGKIGRGIRAAGEAAATEMKSK